MASINGEGYLNIKLADFELAKAYNYTFTSQTCKVNIGIPIYGAPKIFGKDLALKRYYMNFWNDMCGDIE